MEHGFKGVVLLSLAVEAYKFFGRRTEGSRLAGWLTNRLQKAAISMMPSVYLALAIFASILAASVTGIVVPSILLLLPLELSSIAKVIGITSPVLVGLVTFGVFMVYPDLKASSRRADIDKRLPYAVSYLATLASAGVSPVFMFRILANQRDVYGEVAREFGLILRDILVFGRDLLTALERASRRSPSLKFKDFLESFIATVRSGGTLQQFLEAESERLMEERRVKIKELADRVGMMAEFYVILFVVTPLVFIVMSSVMSSLAPGTALSVTALVVLFAFIMMPAGVLAYSLVLDAMNPEK